MLAYFVSKSFSHCVYNVVPVHCVYNVLAPIHQCCSPQSLGAKANKSNGVHSGTAGNPHRTPKGVRRCGVTELKLGVPKNLTHFRPRRLSARTIFLVESGFLACFHFFFCFWSFHGSLRLSQISANHAAEHRY